jgi:hypothetical protein
MFNDDVDIDVELYGADHLISLTFGGRAECCSSRWLQNEVGKIFVGAVHLDVRIAHPKRTRLPFPR